MKKISLIIIIIVISFSFIGCSATPDYTYEEQKAIDTVSGWISKDYFSESDLRVIDNPVGEGKFVYVDLKAFNGAKTYYLWYVKDNSAYAVNGRSLEITGPGKTSLTNPVIKELAGSNLQYLATPDIINMVFKKDNQELINKVNEEIKKIKSEEAAKHVIPTTDLDKKIYEEVEKIWDANLELYGWDKGTAITFGKVAQKYNVSVLDVNTSWELESRRRENRKTKFNREKIREQLKSSLVNSGYSERNGEWYYNGEKVKDLK